MTKRYIFLDIDGVMKPGRSYFCRDRASAMNGGFDPLAVTNGWFIAPDFGHLSHGYVNRTAAI
jgi:hypothetical protein